MLGHYIAKVMTIVAKFALEFEIFFGFMSTFVILECAMMNKLLFADLTLKAGTFFMHGQNVSLKISFENGSVIALITLVNFLLIGLTQILVNHGFMTS